MFAKNVYGTITIIVCGLLSTDYDGDGVSVATTDVGDDQDDGGVGDNDGGDGDDGDDGDDDDVGRERSNVNPHVWLAVSSDTLNFSTMLLKSSKNTAINKNAFEMRKLQSENAFEMRK